MGQWLGFRAGSGGSPSLWDPGGPNNTTETGKEELSSILNILFLYWVKQGAEKTSAPKYNRTESITGTETIEHRE